MGFGKKLKDLLIERRISQGEYAKEIGVYITVVNKVLNEDRDPNFEFLKKTFEYFNDIDLNWWLKDEYDTGDIISKASENQLSYNSGLMDDILKMEAILENLKKKVSQ